MTIARKRKALFTQRIQKELSPAATPAFRGAVMEDRSYSLFQPDVLVASQHLATTKSRTYREPEKKLMLAVLEDALFCFQNGLISRDNRKKRGLSSEAEEWIMEESGDWLFSFNEICELLGLGPQYLRKQLVRWKAELLRRRGRSDVYRLGGNGKNRKTPGGRSGEKKRRYMRAAGF
jgi:hypothetical protein